MTSASSRARSSLVISQIAAGAVIVVAISALAGWALDVEGLRTMMHPARVAMNPMSAVCFVLAAASILFLQHAPADPRGYAWGKGLAAAVAFIALLKLAGYFTPFPLNVDQLLFPTRIDIAGRLPNRMAPNTAVNFLLMGAALLLMDRQVAGKHVTARLTVLVTGLSILALTGYAYDVKQLYHLSGFIAMALNSAIGFVLMCLAILSARPQHEPLATVLSDSLGGVVSRRLLPAAIVLPVLAGWIALRAVGRGIDVPFGMMLFTVTTMAVFVTLIWRNARSLQRLDLQRKEIEEALRGAEAVYHSLVETLPQNIFRKDLDGRFTFGNRNFCQTLGRPLEQIIGKTDLDFFPEALASRYRADDRQVIGTRKPLDIVEEHVKPTGDKLYVQVMKTPVFGPDGDLVGTQGIFWDVTDRKLAEQELEKKNMLLEEAAHSERQAYEALKEAQSHMVQSEKLAGLGQMVAGVAHEINNPLAFVNNNVAVLQRDVKSLVDLVKLYQQAEPQLAEHSPRVMEQVRELSERIDLAYTVDNLSELLKRSRDGLKRIQQIVRDLRDFARLDESDLHEVNLNEGIDSTINIVLGHAKKKHVQVEKRLGNLPPVACYPAKINQVIMNLIVNAIDASHEGGTVTVATSAVDSVVKIEVSDQGTGIDPEIRERIFDPFFTTKPPGQGTGLGLSISYGIMQDHNGEIEVESAVGKGSRFILTLPARRSASHKKAGGEVRSGAAADV
jgi:PAS domain S-box-containing protein